MAGVSFRQRLLDLAEEHEALQDAFAKLRAECDDLRARLAAVAPAEPHYAGDRGRGGYDRDRDLLAPDSSASPLRLRRAGLPMDVAKGRAGATTEAPLALGNGDKGSDMCSESSYSSSVSGGGGGHVRRRRRRAEHGSRRTGGVRRRRRREGSGGRRGRARGRSRSRSRPAPGGGGVGSFGTGDHRVDLDSFIDKNLLEARVAHALRTMTVQEQKKVMGTDGGENSFLLIDRVKNPNAVVMSRIRKLEKLR